MRVEELDPSSSASAHCDESQFFLKIFHEINFPNILIYFEPYGTYFVLYNRLICGIFCTGILNEDELKVPAYLIYNL